MATNTEADKKKMIPVINDHPQVVVQPYNSISELDLNPEGAEEITNGYNGMKDPVIRLSKNKKLSMRHVGFKERAIPVSEEWKWDESEGEAVPPIGREDSVYTESESEKYSDYGSISIEKVTPYQDDPAEELAENLSVVDGTLTENDDPAMIEAIPVLAVERGQSFGLKREGRHGEELGDPITNDNYLTRPGMEVATEDTYLSWVESSSESESPSGDPSTNDNPQQNSTPVTPATTYIYSQVDTSEVATPVSGTEYFISDGADGYVSAGVGGDTLTAWTEGTTYFTREASKKRSTRRSTK